MRAVRKLLHGRPGVASVCHPPGPRPRPQQLAGGRQLGPLDSCDDPYTPTVSNSEGELSTQNMPPNAVGPLPVTESEMRRKKWRTVYDFANWRKHRSPTRFIDRLFKIHKSQVLLNSLPSIAWVATDATLVLAYHVAVEQGLFPADWPILEPGGACAAFINQTGVALSLLLVFRTDESYNRWNEARKLWGDCLNRCRDVMRQGCTYFPKDQPEARRGLARWLIALSRSLRVHFQPEVTLESELRDVLTAEELRILCASRHRPMRAISAISTIVMSVPMHEEYQMNMDNNLTFFSDMLGGCERILRAPIPVSFTRHTDRFLIVWLTLVPLALYPDCGWGVVPVSAGIAAVLCGIEEIGIQCEEPFGVLPLEVICNRIQADVSTMLMEYEETQRVVGDAVVMRGPLGSGPGLRSDGRAWGTNTDLPPAAALNGGGGSSNGAAATAAAVSTLLALETPMAYGLYGHPAAAGSNGNCNGNGNGNGSSGSGPGSMSALGPSIYNSSGLAGPSLSPLAGLPGPQLQQPKVVEVVMSLPALVPPLCTRQQRVEHHLHLRQQQQQRGQLPGQL